MVDGLGEFIAELAGGLFEGVVEWFADGGYARDGSEDDEDHAISRYAESLHEQRPPAPKDLS